MRTTFRRFSRGVRPQPRPRAREAEQPSAAPAAKPSAALRAPAWAEGLEGLLPDNDRRRAHEPAFLKRLRSSVHPRFYVAQLSQVDPAAAAALGPMPTVDAVLDHYVRVGARAGLRVCSLFHPQWYTDQAAELGLEIGDAVPFLHWLAVGWREQVVPTPLFDEAFYLDQNKPAKRYSGWLFEHYLSVGCRLPRFVPSPYGAHHAGARFDDGDPGIDPLMLPELLLRADDFDLTRTSWLEEGVLAAMRQHARLVTSPTLRAIVERTSIAEPMIGVPKAVVRPVTSALHRNLRLRVAAEVDAAVERIGGHVDTVILVPHCRMGGAARVAGIFAHAVQAVAPEQRTLVISTESSAFERPDWFPSDIAVYDLTSHLMGIRGSLRDDVLMDLLRRLAPRRVVNVNSRLGWRVMAGHGHELAGLTTLGAYLFTWEINELGYRGGYPIREFQQAAAHLAWTLFDSAVLREEMVARYALPAAAARRLVLARTPVDAPVLDVAGVFERRRAEGAVLRAFWAGRFDKQKRFDLVVEVARRLPHLEVWAWGKAVVGTGDVDFDDLPPNIRLMGTYADFAELPLGDLDFMLYTAEWDGIPTLLLDGAQAGLPVVASAVGGVPEVIDDTTGYPVADALDPAAYVAAIERLVADPAEATRRVRAVRERIARDFTLVDYEHTVASLLSLRGAQA